MTSYTKTIEKPEITLIVGPDKVKIDDISLNLKKCMSADGAEELAVTLQNLAIALRNAAKAAKALDDRRDDDKATYALMLDNARAAFGPDTRLVIKRGTRTVSMTVISDEWGEDELKGKNFDELQDELAALIDRRKPENFDSDPTDDEDEDSMLEELAAELPRFIDELPDDSDGPEPMALNQIHAELDRMSLDVPVLPDDETAPVRTLESAERN